MLQHPLMAIFRGVTPEEILPIAESLYQIGYRTLEVPLNSPRPYESLRLLYQHYGKACTIGAGTVLTANDVKQVADTGATLIVSPCTDETIIREAKKQNLYMMAGAFTPTECFTALNAGSDALKIFPAELVNPAYIKGIRAVLPKQTPLYLTGGIRTDNMQAFLQAGANGFGIGGGIYTPQKPFTQITQDATLFWQAFNDYQNLE